MAENYVGNAPGANTLNLLGDYAPVGAINFFHGPPDASWLRLQGQTVAKASYPDLWAWALGYLTLDQVANPGLYKEIDASNFALPNFDGMFLRALGGTAAAVGVKQAEMIGPHTHVQIGSTSINVTGGGAGTGGLQAAAVTPYNATQANTGTENRPANIGLVACVKAVKGVVVAPAVGQSPIGQLVQSVAHIRTDWYAPATIAIPGDDTIPQITEGQEYFSVPNFAPMYVGSRIRLTLQFYWTSASIIQMMTALFRSGTANALASMSQVNPAGDFETVQTIEFEFIAASTAPFTYSMRAGGNSGAATSVRMNGRGARILGGSAQSYLRIDEYAPNTAIIATPVGASIAAQADQEAASALDKLVTSGAQKFSPSAAKAYAYVVIPGGTPSIPAGGSFGVTSLVDVTVGRITVNFTTPFSSVAYDASMTFAGGDGNIHIGFESTLTPRTVNGWTTHFNANGAQFDPGAFGVSFFGDQ